MESAGGEALDLPAQYRPGRLLDGAPVVVVKIAKDERASILPGKEVDGLPIGPHLEITETRIPIGQPISILRIHFHVDCEKVIAAMSRAIGQFACEVITRGAFADEASEHVGRSDLDGVDGSILDFL
jgi:hypothetical protein